MTTPSPTTDRECFNAFYFHFYVFRLWSNELSYCYCYYGISANHLSLWRCARYRDERVCYCVSVCSAYLENHTAELHHIFSPVHVASVDVAGSSSDSVAIRYVLPVLWRVTCIPKRRENSVTAETTTSVRTKFCSMLKTSNYSSCVARRWQSLPSTIALCADGVCVVRGGTHARLLQRLLLVPCRLHSLRAVLGARHAEHGAQLRHADRQASASPAAEAQPSTGVSATTGVCVLTVWPRRKVK